MTDSLLPEFATAAPGLDEPLEILEACHDRIEHQLRTLAKLLDHLPQHGADLQAQQAARAIMRYFDTAGRNHHQDEENDLFPMLLRHAADTDNAELVQLIALLRNEHAQMESRWAALREQLDGIAQGKDMLSAAAAEIFGSLYRSHIARENKDILPLAARILTVEDVQKLSRAMTARRRTTV